MEGGKEYRTKATVITAEDIKLEGDGNSKNTFMEKAVLKM